MYVCMYVNILNWSEFKYLGITVTASGGLYNAREKLRKQANKAHFPMLRVLQKINFDTT